MPGLDELSAFAEREILRAGRELWPGAAVDRGAHVPSITGYVRLLRVDGRALYAKYSFLGISLVSLLRGTSGGWSLVRQAQQAYVARPDSPPAREATQLRLLTALGRPKVSVVVGLRHGVLFTQPVVGPTLATLLLDQPHETSNLLEAACDELNRLHCPRTARRFDPAGAVGERSVAHTFQRKFDGLSGALYLDRLGIERCAEHERQEIVQLTRRVVARLRRLRAETATPTRTVLVSRSPKRSSQAGRNRCGRRTGNAK